MKYRAEHMRTPSKRVAKRRNIDMGPRACLFKIHGIATQLQAAIESADEVARAQGLKVQSAGLRKDLARVAAGSDVSLEDLFADPDRLEDLVQGVMRLADRARGGLGPVFSLGVVFLGALECVLGLSNDKALLRSVSLKLRMETRVFEEEEMHRAVLEGSAGPEECLDFLRSWMESVLDEVEDNRLADPSYDPGIFDDSVGPVQSFWNLLAQEPEGVGPTGMGTDDFLRFVDDAARVLLPMSEEDHLPSLQEITSNDQSFAILTGSVMSMAVMFMASRESRVHRQAQVLIAAIQCLNNYRSEDI